MLNTLINNQTIQVDGHQRGTLYKGNWDIPSDDIHVHKRTKKKYAGKYIEAEIRIPLNSERPVKVSIKGKHKSSFLTTVERQVITEIIEAFSNLEIRNAFISDLWDVIIHYESNLSSIDKARAVIKRLAKHFGLSIQIQEQLNNDANKKFEGLTSFYESGQNIFFVRIDQTQIIIGQVNKQD
jgi:hypothetical protein